MIVTYGYCDGNGNGNCNGAVGDANGVVDDVLFIVMMIVMAPNGDSDDTHDGADGAVYDERDGDCDDDA